MPKFELNSTTLTDIPLFDTVVNQLKGTWELNHALNCNRGRLCRQLSND